MNTWRGALLFVLCVLCASVKGAEDTDPTHFVIIPREMAQDLIKELVRLRDANEKLKERLNSSTGCV